MPKGFCADPVATTETPAVGNHVAPGVKLVGLPGIVCEQVAPGRIRLRGFAGGRAYHIGVRAGLGAYDVGRLFFTLPPKQPFRPDPHVIGPIDTQFATDNRWLPPRIDCLVDGELFFSIWCRVPSLAELLNDPRTREALPAMPGLADVNADDGFGPRRFRFFGEGSVIVPRDGMTVELAFTGEGGLPDPEEISVALDSRYERALRLELPPVSAPYPRLFLHGRSSEDWRQRFASLHPELFASFTGLLEDKLAQPPEGRPTRNGDGLEHWDEHDRTACYSFGYALYGREAYYQEALRGVEASLALRHWGMLAAEADTTGDSGAHTSLHWDNDMCQGATRILSMIMFYDWCHARLPPELKERIERKLLHHGELIFRFSLSGFGNWASFPWSDHNTGTVYALQLLGFLFGDRDERAAFWHRWGRVYFEDWRASGPYESGPYWLYFSPQHPNPIVGYIHHTRVLLGEDLARPTDGADAMIAKRLIACRSGRPDWTVHELYGCDAQLQFAMAHVYGNGHAQWLAEDLSRRSPRDWLKAQGIRKILELVYRDPTVAARSPDDLPRWHHNRQDESFWYREGWKSLVNPQAPDETLVVFENHRSKAGVDLRNPHVPRYDWGPLPFRGHFSLIRGRSDYLAKPLSGYVNCTRNGNCLTVDGHGQIGEGSWHPAPVAPCKLTSMDAPRIDVVETPSGPRRRYAARVDLSAAYERSLHLSWIRTLTIWEELRPDGSGRFERLEVVDEVNSDRPRDLVFFCHSQVPIAIRGQGACFAGEAGDLMLALDAGGTPLSLAVADTVYVSSYIPPLGAKPRHLAIRPRTPAASFRLAWNFTYPEKECACTNG